MRKVITTFATIAAMSLTAFAQDSITVKKYVDEMTEDITYMTNADALASTDNRTGFKLMVMITDDLKPGTIIVTTYGMGSKCNKDNILILKFKDGEKIKLKSWNKFSCKTAYFSYPKDAATIAKLNSTEIEKAYFMNGDSYESGTFPLTNPRYFIQLDNSLQGLK